MHRTVAPLLLALLLSPASILGAKEEKPAKKSKSKAEAKPSLDPNAMAYASQFHWADWIEPNFPFFSSTLDAREVGEGSFKDNLTPRGLILNLGHNLWACFDTDLLRIACIWQGEDGKPPVTPVALAPGSYHIAGQKTKDGQDDLPQPIGKVWLANGIYPGWQVLKADAAKKTFSDPIFTDPREPGPDKDEVGRGPLEGKMARFKGVRHTADGTELLLEVGGREVREHIRAEPMAGGVACRTEAIVGPGPSTIAWTDGVCFLPSVSRWSQDKTDWVAFKHQGNEKLECAVILPSEHVTAFAFTHAQQLQDGPKLSPEGLLPGKPAPALWPQSLTTKATLSQKDDAYVVDDIPLPLDNPWKRNVRLADIAFLNDKGDAAAVTMDGDVWLISGLKGDLQEVTWKRFASGLHEPMSIVIRKDEGGRMKDEKASSPPRQDSASSMFVFDRNGIWRLRDTNNDGECDTYEMFCNQFSQTAETREFPNSMKLAPDGSLVISKGGQQGTTLGKHNGSAIRVSPDGKKIDVIGYGLRQPFVGVHPKTGLVTASDQEGNYVPTTPLHIIRDHKFYGHLATIQPHEQYPETIAEPLTWIPHQVIPSGATQTWLADAKMGDINDQLILISYNKPELFRVVGRDLISSTSNEIQSRSTAAVVPWIHNLDFPTLNAAVNPADGQLYAIGFQIWGTTVKRISGLARIRYTGKPRVLLQEALPMDKGVLLRFNLPLDAKLATDPANYNIERWNYKRTFNYGSPHLKQDGTPGQEWMPPSSTYLSKDQKTVFIAIPEMKNTVMQMRVGYGLKSADGLPAQNNVYFTPHELLKFVPEQQGFDRFEPDLTPRKVVAAAAVKPTLEEGKRLYEMMGCMACHSIDGTLYGKVGPSWKGLYGSERLLAKGGDKVTADELYLKESIQNPPAKVVKGFEKLDAGMPVYAGVLNDSQIDSLILFIKSLK
jgi:glucose/arabinose dehydrogenase/cytochrome c2